MIKKIILYIIITFVIIYGLDTLRIVVSSWLSKSTKSFDCEGKIVMVCGEYGCENLCMPLSYKEKPPGLNDVQIEYTVHEKMNVSELTGNVK